MLVVAWTAPFLGAFGAGFDPGGPADGNASKPRAAAGAAPGVHGRVVYRKVRLATSDGWSLAGLYVRVDTGTAVVMLHGLAAGGGEWRPLMDALARRGISSLAIDLRGHGGAMFKGAPRDWRTFADHGPDGEWARMWKDAEAGYRFLLAGGHKRVGVAGASVGANAALQAAVEIPRVAFLVLLSPGIDYQGIRSPEAAARYGPRVMLLAVSAPDAYAYQSVDALRRLRLAAHLPVEWLEAKAGHGAQMFQEPGVLSRIADWIARERVP